jgi:hypothetical protein
MAAPHPPRIDLARHGTQVHVHAWNASGREIGQAYLEPPFAPLSETCKRDLEDLRRDLGRPDLQVMVLRRSEIRSAYWRGRGLGTAMYLAAAREAARQGAALVADECHWRSTSADAKRVWTGRRFNAQVARRGLVAYWTGVGARPNPAALAAWRPECDAGPTPRHVDAGHPQAARIARLVRLVAAWRRDLVRWLRQQGGDDLWNDVANLARNEGATLRRLAAKAGVRFLGVGSSRVAFLLDGDEVVKIEYNTIDEIGSANLRELRRWVHDPPAVARWYAPVTASAPDFSWITMVRATPLPAIGRFTPPPGAPRLGDEVVRENWGLYCGRRVLVDYAGD